MTQKAIWFSPHKSTAAQICDARKRGYDIEAIQYGRALASRKLISLQDVAIVCRSLLVACERHQAKAIFGAWSTPMLTVLFLDANDASSNERAWQAIPCWSAWNVGDTHCAWQIIGRLSSHGLRWALPFLRV